MRIVHMPGGTRHSLTTGSASLRRTWQIKISSLIRRRPTNCVGKKKAPVLGAPGLSRAFIPQRGSGIGEMKKESHPITYWGQVCSQLQPGSPMGSALFRAAQMDT
jgi:hypothetical protein